MTGETFGFNALVRNYLYIRITKVNKNKRSLRGACVRRDAAFSALQDCTLTFTGIFELVLTCLALIIQSALSLSRHGTSTVAALHERSSSNKERSSSNRERSISLQCSRMHWCAAAALWFSGCYLELEPSPPEVMVLGAFLDRDFACTFACLFFSSLRANLRPHASQVNGFSPEEKIV